MLSFSAIAAKPGSDGLSPETQPDSGALQAAMDAASGPSGGHALSNPVVFVAQSFRIRDHGRQAGTLVSGRGTLPALSSGADPVNTCFVSFVRQGSAPSIVLTVGAGDWETEGCSGVAAVGLLAGAGADHRAAIVYKAFAAHTAPLEPIVLAWSQAGALTIDSAASKRASLAGATTLAEIRATLR